MSAISIAGVLGAGLFGVVLGLGTAMAQQGADPVSTITAGEIQRHLSVIANDSMQGRDTPSPGLEATARYVAEQFAQAGLEPASVLRDQSARFKYSKSFGTGLSFRGRHSSTLATWFQRYPVPLAFDFARSAVVFTTADRRIAAGFTAAARILPYPFMSQLYLAAQPGIAPKVLLVAGNHPANWLAQIKKDDRIVLYVPPPASETNADGVEIPAGGGKPSAPAIDLNDSSRGVVVLSGEDSATFASRLAAQFHRVIQRDRDDKWLALVRPEAVPGLRELLAGVGVDVARLRADTTPVMREVPGLRLALEAQFQEMPVDTATAPNVVGLLEGSDPKLKDEFVVFMAHMDHTGQRTEPTDSTARRVTDNAVGVAGLLALAKAFGQSGARPRRSVLFVATSGGAKPGFWGSNALAEGLIHFTMMSLVPIIPVVITVNLDLSGPAARDSVLIDGLQLVDLPVSPTWVAAAHRELGLTVMDGGTVFAPRSDHFAFTSHAFLALPSLNVHGGPWQDAPGVADSAGAPSAEQIARIVRLVSYIGRVLTDSDRSPRWNERGRREVMLPEP